MTRKYYALAGLAAPLLFWTSYAVLSSLRPEYSCLTKAVSELGSLDAPYRYIWNVAGYILPGLLIALFSIGMYHNIAREQASRLPLMSMLLSGLFMAMAGVFPGDFEHRQSATMLWHSVGSFGSYLFFLTGAFSYPALMRRRENWQRIAGPSLALVWISIVFGAWPFVFPDFPALGQRFVFAAYFLWIGGCAYTLAKSRN